MRRIGFGVLMVVLLGTLGCAPKMKVERSFDWTADFQHYHTWFWIDGKPALMDILLGDDLTDQIIRRAISEELQAKGMTAQADEPDLLVRYTTKFQEAVANSPGNLGYSYQWRWSRDAQGTGQGRTYGQGTLIIDLVDRKTGLLVWQGKATGVVHDPENAKGKIREAVRKILALYPPTP